jgi:hypothetical protein
MSFFKHIQAELVKGDVQVVATCIFSHMSWHRTCQEAPVNDAENDKDSHSH